MEHQKFIIGATTEVDIPLFGIKGLLARVDTGAASCALHAQNIQIVHEGHYKKLSFTLFDSENERYTGELIEVTDFSTRNVKNSFGNRKERPFITTEIIIDGDPFEVEIGLIDRSNLTYDMLLGRNLLRQGFIVDVTK